MSNASGTSTKSKEGSTGAIPPDGAVATGVVAPSSKDPEEAGDRVPAPPGSSAAHLCGDSYYCHCTEYDCPVCESPVECVMGDSKTIWVCPDCKSQLRLDVDADCDADGYFDCSALHVAEVKP